MVLVKARLQEAGTCTWPTSRETLEGRGNYDEKQSQFEPAIGGLDIRGSGKRFEFQHGVGGKCKRD